MVQTDETTNMIATLAPKFESLQEYCTYCDGHPRSWPMGVGRAMCPHCWGKGYTVLPLEKVDCFALMEEVWALKCVVNIEPVWSEEEIVLYEVELEGVYGSPYNGQAHHQNPRIALIMAVHAAMSEVKE